MVTMASTMASNTAAPTTGDVTTTTTVQKKGSENRRSNKPIMEKRRRARINNCLNELKTLILDAMKKDPARHSKLEKADILEMTVKHLESLQRQQVAMSAVTDPQVVNKFRAGFSECAGEVGRFPGLEPAVRRRLLQHLANCLSSTPAPATGVSSSANSPSPPATGAPPDLSGRRLPLHPQHQNLQVHILPAAATGENTISAAVQSATTGGSIFLSAGATSGVQLVPTRLPNGDIALVLPSVTATSFQQRLSSASPSPSSSSSSPPPLAMLTPSRTASTSSAVSSSNSPIAFERLSVNTAPSSVSSSNVSANGILPANDDVSSCHSSNSSCSSVHSNYSDPQSPINMSSDSYHHIRPYSPPMPKPLSLVVRESYLDCSAEEKPWRPW